MTVKSTNMTWEIKKRYSEFLSFSQNLLQTADKVHLLPKLPPKMIFGNMKTHNIEKRKEKLNQYLQALLAVQKDVMVSKSCVQLFQLFFETKRLTESMVDENVRRVSLRSSFHKVKETSLLLNSNRDQLQLCLPF
jgi:hypothetical protein